MQYKKVPQQINDVIGDNVKKLAQLFPSVVKDGEVDFEALKEELGQFEEVGSERYELTWAGKKNAKRIVQEDIAGKTLKFIPEESKNADTTENLYIEGDNLEVLKLLRQNYYGAIKMIYIDPPYNTGNDFVYNDSFEMSKEESNIAEGASGINGEQYLINKMSQNRFHANWLNMIYPRLKIAKDLLTDDGVIFISIDENEMTNLRKICDEVFGNKQFIALITLLCNPKGRSQDKYIANCHEYILVYSKTTLPGGSVSIPKTEEDISSDYKLTDENGAYREIELRNTHRDFGKFNRSNLWYPFYVDPTGKISTSYIKGAEEIYPVWDDGFEGCWTWGIEKASKEINLLTAKKVNGKTKIYRKSYAFADDTAPLKQVKSIWTDKEFFTEKGQKSVNELFRCKEKIFQAPKSVDMIMQCVQMSQDENEIILDFFGGSSTTAQATMQLNAKDGGHRKFIIVQLPEKIDEKSDAYKAGYSNICEIGKERIRRAGTKIKEDNPHVDIDIGFKVFRVTDTNIKWNSLMDVGQINLEQLETTPDQMDFMPHVNDIDIVYELMLRQRNIPLSEPLERLVGIGNRTYLYASSFLVCLETKITEKMISKLAELDPLPIKYIFRDSAFKDDIALKDETFRRLKALVEKNAGTNKPTYTVEFI